MKFFLSSVTFLLRSLPYLSGHADQNAVHQYLQLSTKIGNKLMLSSEHLLHVGCYGNLRAAKDVRDGDNILLLADGKLLKSEVIAIKTTVLRGAYCPHTTGK